MTSIALRGKIVQVRDMFTVEANVKLYVIYRKVPFSLSIPNTPVFNARRYASAVHVVAVCLSVRPSASHHAMPYDSRGL